jgi:hypothetical protein
MVVLFRVCDIRGFQIKIDRVDVLPCENFAEFRQVEEPISKRKADLIARPQRIEILNQILNSTKELVKSSRELFASTLPKSKTSEDDLEDETATTTETPPVLGFQFEEKSIAGLETLISEVETWLSEKIAAQEKLKLWEEPVLLLNEIEKKGTQIQNALRKMVMEQAKPKAKPKKSSTSSSSTSSTTTASSETTGSASSSEASVESVETDKPIYTEVEEDLEETVTTTVTSMIIEEAASPTGEIKHEEL